MSLCRETLTNVGIVTGQILDRRRSDRRKMPTGLMLQMRINEVDELFDQVMGLMEDCPAVLRLDMENDVKSRLVFTLLHEVAAADDL